MVHLSGADVCVMFHDLDIKVKVTARSKVKFTVIATSSKLLCLGLKFSCDGAFYLGLMFMQCSMSLTSRPGSE